MGVFSAVWFTASFLILMCVPRLFSAAGYRPARLFISLPWFHGSHPTDRVAVGDLSWESSSSSSSEKKKKTFFKFEHQFWCRTCWFICLFLTTWWKPKSGRWDEISKNTCDMFFSLGFVVFYFKWFNIKCTKGRMLIKCCHVLCSLSQGSNRKCKY